jgi:hypothetical protein
MIKPEMSRFTQTLSEELTLAWNEDSEESQNTIDSMFESMIDALKMVDSNNVFGSDRPNTPTLR